MSKPNRVVRMVFEECDTDQDDIKALKVFLDTPERPLDEAWADGDDQTLAEVWATDVMSFVESYMHRQMMENDVNGFVMTTPKKGDMN